MGFINTCFFKSFLDTGGNYTGEEFFDPRETPYIPSNPPTPSNRQGRFKQQACGGAANAARPPASSKKQFFARKRKEKPGRGDGRPNSKPPGMNGPYGIDIAR